MNRHSGGAFETIDRKPSAGLASPESGEIPLQGPGRCEAAGKHFGILGSCEAAWRGGKEGGALGDCEAARRGGKAGGQHSPEVLEKCRKAGREAGMLGKPWGMMGWRPRDESQTGSAPVFAKRGLLRPKKWEPQVGHQLQAVTYIREQLRTRRLGKFTKEEGAGEDGAEEEWEEPEVNDVEEQVWTEIRERGFGGNKVKNRDLMRIWIRRTNLAKAVELLELVRAGWVHKRRRGWQGQRCMHALEVARGVWWRR